MVTGFMTLVNDPRLLSQLVASGFKVINMSEELHSPEFLAASMLLPNYDAISELINGDTFAFYNRYSEQLLSKECDFFISAIYTAMLKGAKIAVFSDNTDDIGSQVLIGFGKHMATIFGIQPEYPKYNVTFSEHPSGLGFALDRLYSHNLISGYEYLMHQPANANININVLAKLIREIQPIVDTLNCESYIRALTRIKIQMQTQGVIFVNPIMSPPPDNLEEILMGVGDRNDSIYW